MRYYKLMYDYENSENYADCGNCDIGNMDRYIIYDGKKIKDWENVEFEYDAKEGDILTDYLSNIYCWLVVSAGFVEATKNIIGEQVQYLPLKVKESNSKIEIDSYSVVNVVNVVDAFDRENSIYDIFELDDEEVLTVERYALKAKEIGSNHIFCLKDDEIPIFVSEKVKNAIEENNLLGFDFYEVKVV